MVALRHWWTPEQVSSSPRNSAKCACRGIRRPPPQAEVRLRSRQPLRWPLAFHGVPHRLCRCQGPTRRQAIACRCCATSPKRVFHVGFGGGDATVASPEFQVPADTLRRTECSCQAALNPGESHAIRSAGPNQDDGRPHSVRVREGTPFAGCEDGLRPTSDGDRGPQCDAGQPAATTSFTEALWHQSCTETRLHTK